MEKIELHEAKIRRKNLKNRTREQREKVTKLLKENEGMAYNWHDLRRETGVDFYYSELFSTRLLTDLLDLLSLGFLKRVRRRDEYIVYCRYWDW